MKSLKQKNERRKIEIKYRLVIKTAEGQKVYETSTDKKELDKKAVKLSNENPLWNVFVVRENYNVS